jgi:hypothetical protein
MVTLLLIVASGTWLNAQSCAYFNEAITFPYTSPYGYAEHSNGSHGWQELISASCTYSNGPVKPDYTIPCDVVATASSYGTATWESGNLSNPLKTHKGTTATAQGSGGANGGLPITVDTEGAATINSCYISCSTTPTISGSGNGLGFSVSFPAASVFSDKKYYKNACAGESTVKNCGRCPCGWPAGTGCGSPILIDTTGKGFHFTDPNKECVMFDLENTGKPKCYSWPKAGSGNAWLVYDRDNDGKIDSGAELFGSFTPHSDGDYLVALGLPKPTPANGFIALMWFDQPQQGGSNRLEIDKTNPLWSHLYLWIDTHCQKHVGEPCSALPTELHRPEEFKIYSLGVVYTSDKKQDKYGNWFRFYAQVNPKSEAMQYPKDAIERRMYDVWLMSK